MSTPTKKLTLGLLILLIAASNAAAQIVPSPKLPATTPWDLEKLGEVPAFEWVDEKGSIRSLFYEGEPYGGRPTRVFAYFASPATLADRDANDGSGRKYPAVILVHGGGGTAFQEWCELWAKRGYAAIAMDLAGHRPVEGQNAHRPENRARLHDGGPNQGDEEKFGSIDKPPAEQWTYHAVAAVLRAHSLVRSFPEIDANRTAVTGISWGGYLTCIVAGVDNRFKAAVPVYGCGFLDENSTWLTRFEKMTPEQRQRWVTLWDPSRYLPAVSMPIFFVNGTNDSAYPLDSYIKSYDAVTAPRQLRITVNMPHGHPPGWAPQEIGLFIDAILRDGVPLPSLDVPHIVNDRQLRVGYTSGSKLTNAALHYTTDSGAINMRTWKSLPAIIDDKAVTSAPPPPEVSAWFVTVTDERGAVVSSTVSFPNYESEGDLSPEIGKRLQAGLPVRIVCFGDSVTGLYYHTGGRRAYTDMLGLALQKLYPRAELAMYNAGVSGQTTADGLARIDRDVLTRQPTIVTVMFGLNDMTRVPLDAYRANLETIIDKCLAAGAEVVLCTPNNVIATENRPSEKLEQYCDAVRAVGTARKVPVCDCYRDLEAFRERDALDWRLMMSDEIHPNMDGHKRLAESLARVIGGRDVSLADVPPPRDPLSRTVARLKTGQSVKVLAMPPFDDLVDAALAQAAPDASLDFLPWPTAGKSLAEIEHDAKSRVRALKPDLVLIAVPRSATADSTESFIRSYSWIMNWSLSFGVQEWDVVVVHPAVAEPENSDRERDNLVRRLVRAQDLTLIERQDDDKSTAADIINQWFDARIATVNR